MQGYETTRACTAPVDENTLEWTERVFVVYSETYAKSQERGLEQRLTTATTKLNALTPPRSRGQRQIKDEAQLTQAAQAILQAQRVEGLLSYTFERQAEQRTQFVGRGRGAPNRLQRMVEHVRNQITAVARHAADITALKDTFGWRAYATDLPVEDLTFEEAVVTYRDEWLVERSFHRLKGAPLSLTPLFVKRDDQVVGLIH